MANKNILTNGAKVTSVGQVYYSPASVVSTTGSILASFYAFLAKVEAWPDENNPPTPTQDQSSLKKIYKNIFVTKKITVNDISPVIERINWVNNTVYSYYRDDIDMLELDENGFLVNKFYVKNRYDQVFKCLWNNNGGTSTIEPKFEPGTYGINNIYQGVDGYKWKYIYTVDVGTKVKFMDTTWMPVPVGTLILSSRKNAAGSGDIEVINVVSGGTGYDPANAVVTVTVTGDGLGATGTAVVNNGIVTNVIVTNAGGNYTYANVAITSTIGSNATAICPVSPIAGHGSDPISELGGSHVMLTAQFNGTEGGKIPTDIDFHQVGLLVNPSTAESYPKIADGAVYKTSTDLVLAQGFGTYTQDEWVYQGSSLETASFKATVLSFDSVNSILKLINITGTPVTNAPVFGDTSKTVRTLLSVSSPSYSIFSGYIAFVENRTGIQRSEDGIEQFKFVLGY